MHILCEQVKLTTAKCIKMKKHH